MVCTRLPTLSSHHDIVFFFQRRRQHRHHEGQQLETAMNQMNEIETTELSNRIEDQKLQEEAEFEDFQKRATHPMVRRSMKHKIQTV